MNPLRKPLCVPTVCTEGTIQHHGSHGAFHANLERVIRERRMVDNMRKPRNSKIGEISYQDAREATIRTHRQTFPLSFCSNDCLSAQLDQYFNEACKNQAGIIGKPNPTLQYKEIVKLPTEPEVATGDEL